MADTGAGDASGADGSDTPGSGDTGPAPTEGLELVISPETLLFEAVAVGDTDLQSFTARNAGDAELVILDAVVEGPDGVFAIADGYSPGMTLDVGDTAEFFVTYSPRTASAPAGSIRLVTDRGDIVVELLVRGRGGRVFVNPDPISFGRVPAGDMATVLVAVTNIGSGPLGVSEITLDSASGAFTIPGDQRLDEPITLSPDERFPFDVVFAPRDGRADRAALVVRSDDAANPEFTVDLFAAETDRCMEVSHESAGFDFGPRLVGDAHGEMFTLRNCADPGWGDVLVVEAIGLRDDAGFRSSDAFTLDRLPAFPLVLEPLQEQNFLVVFTPTVSGSDESGIVEVTVGGADSSVVEIPVAGRGAPTSCPTPVAQCSVAGSGAPPASELYVVPLDTITCTGAGAPEDDGEVVAYDWAVTERPAGSTSQLDSDVPTTNFFVDLPGRYTISLSITDDSGCTSPEPAQVRVIARPDEDLHVHLVWTTPGDTDPTDVGFGAGADLDLHLLHPNGCWEDSVWDCHFRQREPNWGDPGASDDDPSLDIDYTDGAGPEVINLDNPENGVTYRVGVHYYNDHGYGPSVATVRVYVFGEMMFEARDTELPYPDAWWEVVSIAWPSMSISPIDVIGSDVPSCE